MNHLILISIFLISLVVDQQMKFKLAIKPMLRAKTIINSNLRG